MVLVLAGFLVAGCTSAGTQTPVVQTVVQTVEMEVTRNVVVTRIVEVTRDVVVTQVVEQQVTVTPNAPETLPAVQAQNQTAAVLVNITPQVTPQEKYMGYTPIFVQNKTNDRMDVYLAGPDEFNLVLWGGNQQKIWAREGGYAYTVWINGQEAYHGKFNIVSADKYNLLLHADKAVLWVP
jgi:hypothetical protein